MKRFFRELFCLHDWERGGHQDFCDISVVFTNYEERRMRRTYWHCRKCNKVTWNESFVSIRK
jgi:hypothetical protein